MTWKLNNNLADNKGTGAGINSHRIIRELDTGKQAGGAESDGTERQAGRAGKKGQVNQGELTGDRRELEMQELERKPSMEGEKAESGRE